VDLAVRSLSRGNVERLPPLLSSTREALDRLSRLTANLVEASRGETPQVSRTPQDLVQLIAQACRWARAAAVSKGLSLEWEREPAHLWVPGDADALLSVLGNLLSNAIRYTHAGAVRVRHGTYVSAAALAPAESAQDPEALSSGPPAGNDAPESAAHWAWVEVADTGVGMLSEVRERIFEKFFRAADTRSSGGQGLGLGLSLVEQLVRAHQGRVEVESAPGRGSTFRVWLPALPGSPHAAGAAAKAAVSAAGGTAAAGSDAERLDDQTDAAARMWDEVAQRHFAETR
jgi:signal transduction histidine kinase